MPGTGTRDKILRPFRCILSRLGLLQLSRRRATRDAASVWLRTVTTVLMITAPGPKSRKLGDQYYMSFPTLILQSFLVEVGYGSALERGTGTSSRESK